MARTAGTPLLFPALALLLLAAGCGGSQGGSSTTVSPTPEAPGVEPPETRDAPGPQPETAPRDCPAIACGGCSGGYATEPDGCPSCRCLFDEPAVMTAPAP